jgi:hypothetical protein
LLDLLLEEIKINISSGGYMTNLAQKLNRFIVKDYFDKLKELLPRQWIMCKGNSNLANYYAETNVPRYKISVFK